MQKLIVRNRALLDQDLKNAENFSTKALAIEVVLFANLMKCTSL